MAPKRNREAAREESRRTTRAERATTSANPRGAEEEETRPSHAINLMPEEVPVFKLKMLRL